MVPSIERDVLDQVIDQANKISSDCEYSATSNFALGRYWDGWNLKLGLTSALLAAVAAYLAVGEGRIPIGNMQNVAQSVTGVVAFLSTIAVSILTFLKPSEKASVYREFGNKYRSIRNRSRVFVSIDCLVESDYQKLRNGLNALLKEKEDLNMDNPVIPQWAFSEAQKLIDEKILRKKKHAE